jgi:hypothetical protein
MYVLRLLVCCLFSITASSGYRSRSRERDAWSHQLVMWSAKVPRARVLHMKLTVDHWVSALPCTLVQGKLLKAVLWLSHGKSKNRHLHSSVTTWPGSIQFYTSNPRPNTTSQAKFGLGFNSPNYVFWWGCSLDVDILVSRRSLKRLGLVMDDN